MTKIKTIEVVNFKAVKESIANFNGCSAIITAGNNKGKTSVLRGLIDRFRGEKPDVIVNDGEEKGFNKMELTDGSIIEWKFTEKSESFSFTTADGIIQKTGVLSAIGKRYFGLKFDIDKFINSSATVQTKELQKLVGVDFSDVDNRYKTAYESRTDANKEVKRIQGLGIMKPVKIEEPDSAKLKTQLSDAKSENSELKTKWEADNKVHQKDTVEFNEEQDLRKSDIEEAKSSMKILETLEEGIFIECVDFKQAKKIQSELPAVEEKKILTSLPEPTYTDVDAIQEKIDAISEEIIEYNNYSTKLEAYNNHIDSEEKAINSQTKCDILVKEIETEKLALIQSANIPDEFEITDDGILYKGLPLTDTQISSSAKYISALKLGSLVLGKIRTMHFDASYLDKNSLAEIQVWADGEDLQLLIEKPDFEAGDIRYEIIEK